MNPTQNPTLPYRRHALVLALTLALASPTLSAATFNVSGTCTLDSAISNANTDTDTDGTNVGCPAGNGSDVINLAKKATYALANKLLPTISSVITINGNHATIDSKALYARAFYITNTGNLTLNKLTVKNGYEQKGGGILNRGQLQLNDSTITGNGVYAACDYYCFGSYGGGIFNSGTATLTNSKVSNNTADAGYSINGDSGRGGGIYNSGVMTLTNSTVSNNKTLGSHYRGEGPMGGGIINFGTMTLNGSTVANNSADSEGGGIRNRGTMTLTDSTVSHNNAPSGGGIYSGHFIFSSNTLTLTNSTVVNNQATGGGGIFNAQVLNLSNSTVSANKASNSGGGIANKGVLNLTHSTLSANQAAKGNGGGIFNLHNMTLTNTLIANSQSGGDCVNKSGGITTLQGVNLVEDGSCGADIMGDPKLVTLLDNGGITATQALLADSPALDTANKPLCTNQDQRGISRPQPSGGGCDIGAFERMTSIPNTVASVVQFFDNGILTGTLVGTGNTKQSPLFSSALRNQLLAAGRYKNQNQTASACSQLSRTLKRIDTDNTPSSGEYVTGSDATALAAKLAGLFGPWSCQ
jgi:hypothetical protein